MKAYLIEGPNDEKHLIMSKHESAAINFVRAVQGTVIGCYEMAGLSSAEITKVQKAMQPKSKKKR